jgi:tetratricopeptide (TPR) repeat protein
MREEYYGSYSYDFRPFVLPNVAERISRELPQAAFAILEYNLERYPDDQQTFVTMAQIHQAMGDRDALIATLERAVEALPDNQFFRQTLQRLREN